MKIEIRMNTHAIGEIKQSGGAEKGKGKKGKGKTFEPVILETR